MEKIEEWEERGEIAEKGRGKSDGAYLPILVPRS